METETATYYVVRTTYTYILQGAGGMATESTAGAGDPHIHTHVLLYPQQVFCTASPILA